MDTDPLTQLLARVRADMAGLKKDVDAEKANAHASINGLKLLEKLIIMLVQDAIANINDLSTALDSFSLTEDRLNTDVPAAIAALQAAVVAANGTLTPEQEAAVTRGQASLAALKTMGDKADALVAQVDAVLPQPAPAGTVTTAAAVRK